MNHDKDFLIKLQTLDIKVNQRSKVINGASHQINFYDISQQNPYLSASFHNEFKELKELAITDILNLPREEILFQLQRLSGVKELLVGSGITYTIPILHQELSTYCVIYKLRSQWHIHCLIIKTDLQHHTILHTTFLSTRQGHKQAKKKTTNEHFFNSVKQIDIVEYLKKLGCQPQKIRKNDYWY